jgi:hypothetical protein
VACDRGMAIPLVNGSLEHSGPVVHQTDRARQRRVSILETRRYQGIG